MKKVVLSLLSLSLLTVACEKESPTQSLSPTSSIKRKVNVQDDGKGPYSKPHVRFRHGVGCSWALGVCVIFGSDPSNGATPGDGFGTASARLEDGKLHMIFDEQAANAEGVVSISEDISVTDWLGHKSVIVYAGEYQADMSSYEFGEIWANTKLID